MKRYKSISSENTVEHCIFEIDDMKDGTFNIDFLMIRGEKVKGHIKVGLFKELLELEGSRENGLTL